MKTVKKATLILAGILAVVLLITCISFLLFKPLYYRLFYFEDRITGTVSVTIDGEPYALKAGDLSAIHNGSKETGVKFHNRADAAEVSVHGGEYGPYTLLIRIDGMDSPLEVVIYQYNWYNVVGFDLDIAIDRAAGTITFTSTARVLSETGEHSTENRTTTVDFSDRHYVHYVVTARAA